MLRRILAAVILAWSALSCASNAALFSGAPVSGGGAGLITSSGVIANNTGSNIAANSVTQILGMGFAKGVLTNGCSGSAPVFKIHADSAIIPFSESVTPVCWNDGSLKFASFLLRDPEGVNANTSIAFDVYTGGTTPANSNRTTADYTAGGLDLNSQITGLDQPSGSWEADVGAGITTYSTTKFMDGAAGRVDMGWADYKQSGSAHGQLMLRTYLQALQDSSGNLYGVRYLFRTTAPWYNVVSPAANFWSFSAIGDFNGISQITNLWSAQSAPFSFTATGGSSTLSATVNANLQSGVIIRVSNSGGALPGGLSAGTDYFLSNGNGGNNPYTYNAFSLGTDSGAVAGGTSLVTPSTNGTGTQTAQAYPYITQFGSIFDAQSNGRYNYIQGNGSIAADAALQVHFSCAYWRSTHLTMPYACATYSPTDISAYNFSAMTAGPVDRVFGEEGERGDLGPMNLWEALYFFNQTATDEQNLRTVGLIGGQLPVHFLDHSTKFPPIINAGSYGSLPSLSTSARWDGTNGNASGFTAPATTSVYLAGFAELDTTHIPDFEMGAFLATGEPQYMELGEELGLSAVMNRYTTSDTAIVNSTTMAIGGNNGAQRNNTINGTTYNGILLGGSGLLRNDAWAFRNLSGAVMEAKEDPNCTSCSAYFDAMTTATENAWASYNAMFGSSFPWVTNNGVYSETSNTAGGVTDSWTIGGYWLNTWNLSRSWTEDGSGIDTVINYMNKWPAHVNNTFGTSYVPYYQALMRISPNNNTSAFVSSDTNVAFFGLNISWNSTATFTLISAPAGYTLTNGDRVMFNTGEIVPGGFSGETTYCMLNVTGTTLQLNNCSGGGAISATNNGSSAGVGGVYWWGTSLTSPNLPGNSTEPYAAGILCALQFATANSLTVDATTLSNMTTLIQGQSNYPGYFNGDPRYACQTSF